MFKPELYGKYLLIDRISVGGMAEVFRAVSVKVEGFKKVIAIKRILPNISREEEFIRMFVDEANIAGELHHAGIAQIYDLGRVSDSFFIAMEYVRGRDLRAVFDKLKKTRRRIPAPVCLSVAAGMLAALDYAHNKRDLSGRELGIVHRDVSPPNILISYDGEVKLIDFGVAKAANKISRTQAGILKGKFGYMSPEQVTGGEISRRSDLFSVGIILYEMLTGRRLFLGRSDYSTLEKVRSLPIEPPIGIQPDLPPQIDRIVLRALERDPEIRYQSAAEMLRDVRRCLIEIGGEEDGTVMLGRFMRDLFEQEFAEDAQKLDEFSRLDLSQYTGLIEGGVYESLRQDGRQVEPLTVEPEDVLPADRQTASDRSERQAGRDGSRWRNAVAGTSALLAALLAVALLFTWHPPYQPVPGVVTGSSRSGTLALTANVPATTVSVAGQTLGVTPLWIPGVEAGTHEITFSKPGYLDWKETVEIEPGETLRANGRMFQPGTVFGAIYVISRPAGARVELDGTDTEKLTPALLEGLPAGVPHRVRAMLDGYAPGEQAGLPVAPEEIAVARIELQPVLPVVVIESTPPGATVAINDRTLPGHTPTRYVGAALGEPVRVSVSLPGHLTYAERFLVDSVREYHVKALLVAGQPAGSPAPAPAAAPGRVPTAASTSTQTATARRPAPAPAAASVAEEAYGYLDISSKPWAKIYLDGKNTNKFTPYKNLKIPAGKHEVKLINPAQNVHDIFIIEIQPGRTLRVEKTYP